MKTQEMLEPIRITVIIEGRRFSLTPEEFEMYHKKQEELSKKEHDMEKRKTIWVTVRDKEGNLRSVPQEVAREAEKRGELYNYDTSQSKPPKA